MLYAKNSGADIAITANRENDSATKGKIRVIKGDSGVDSRKFGNPALSIDRDFHLLSWKNPFNYVDLNDVANLSGNSLLKSKENS